MEKMEHTNQNCKDAYMDNEPLFLNELFIEECDHNDEKTCIEDLKFRVPFEKSKLDLSIFTFDEPINDHTFQNLIQESLINQSFETLFEDELIYLNESVSDALVNYTPPKKIIDLSIEVMFADELKVIGNHIVVTLIMLCDNDEFMRKKCEKKRKRRWRKVMNKWR